MDAIAPLSEYVRFLVALTAVLDPFFAAPMFLALTEGFGAGRRRRTALVTSVAVFLTLAGAVLVGEAALALMGTSVAALRVGGGLVLLLMALAMINAQVGGVRQSPEEAHELEGGTSTGVVPLAIPMLAGPGAISMVIIAAEHGSWPHRAALIAGIGAVCLLLYSVLRLAAALGRFMGPTVRNVATRLLGLLLAAIAVQTIAAGLVQLFPALAG